MALNESIFTSAANTTKLGRVLNNYSGNTATMINNYGRSDMNMKYSTNAQGTTGTTYTVPDNQASADSKHGANITANEWNSTIWWTGTAHFSTEHWNIANNKLPTLRNMPGTAVQDPVITVNYTPGQIIGSGTQADPFKVHDVETLERVGKGTNEYAAWSLSAHYLQVRDITLPAVSAGESNWTAIGGPYLAESFTGTYDGGGKTITGLTIDATDTNRQGLFRRVMDNGTVKNVGLVNVSISGGGDVGGIAGYTESSTISNCYVTGTITCSANFGSVGGITGENGGMITNCYVEADITHTGGQSAGGIAGVNQITIENCYTTGNISSGNSTGGVVGVNHGQITNCYTTGNVSGSNVRTGGMAGETSASFGTTVIENNVALNQNVTSTYGSTAQLGRVVGSIENSNIMINNYARSGMTITYDGTYTPNPGLTTKDGADITATQWNSANWWQNTALFPDSAWEFRAGLPTLKNMPAGAQNPEVQN